MGEMLRYSLLNHVVHKDVILDQIRKNNEHLNPVFVDRLWNVMDASKLWKSPKLGKVQVRKCLVMLLVEISPHRYCVLSHQAPLLSTGTRSSSSLLSPVATSAKQPHTSTSSSFSQRSPRKYAHRGQSPLRRKRIPVRWSPASCLQRCAPSPLLWRFACRKQHPRCRY